MYSCPWKNYQYYCVEFCIEKGKNLTLEYERTLESDFLFFIIIF